MDPFAMLLAQAQQSADQQNKEESELERLEMLIGQEMSMLTQLELTREQRLQEVEMKFQCELEGLERDQEIIRGRSEQKIDLRREVVLKELTTWEDGFRNKQQVKKDRLEAEKASLAREVEKLTRNVSDKQKELLDRQIELKHEALDRAKERAEHAAERRAAHQTQIKEIKLKIAEKKMNSHKADGIAESISCSAHHQNVISARCRGIRQAQDDVTDAWNLLRSSITNYDGNSNRDPDIDKRAQALLDKVESLIKCARSARDDCDALVSIPVDKRVALKLVCDKMIKLSDQIIDRITSIASAVQAGQKLLITSVLDLTEAIRLLKVEVEQIPSMNTVDQISLLKTSLDKLTYGAPTPNLAIEMKKGDIERGGLLPIRNSSSEFGDH
ncbi:unnamed protein product [Caenorhabditis auriculariae]|uniref:Uncharacterized protein n=1 Tax=Caenorhabditis auriculariae TaxID=2777116 RepID=A0A8S1HUR3_9PELO|nr:unnamed protein product [Caenorhabditis auriculariae]